ncbi:M23 family metallopeptidase [Cryobacterium sp. SO1]|uniref:M23 family metallopeptidase n=1 Tax=Cryobacterium sp. SO1 TaxID=1897061 RepID=UPI0010234EC8|nr:M23 family metallopeptidase [Cryobacterium sp. SO1]RZI34163.1 Glycyl-glycine endopeptidase LytM [Cryobacterium sp. SO1]
MSHSQPSRESPPGPALLSLPFTGRWMATNSPARRIPSHGTDLLGERYAIDFVGVDERGRTAAVRSWGTFFGTEPPERFVAFGRPILAPAGGTVVRVHDGEPDHVARRSQLSLIPYALGQAARLRQGVGAIAGNHVVIRLADGAGFVALVHLRNGSMRVRVGEVVHTGDLLAQCGNSGNSTQPHVHLQVMDNLDLARAAGLPVRFREYRVWPTGGRGAKLHESGLPGEGVVVEPIRPMA